MGHTERLLTEEQHAFFVDHVQGRTSGELTELMNRTFGLSLKVFQVCAYRKNHRLPCGVVTRFPKGHVPWAKGKPASERFRSEEGYRKWMESRTFDHECFICGGEVAPSEDVRAMVKAFEQGMPVVPSSKRFFICLSCGAYVMADADDPERPCGTIADPEIRYLRRRVRQEAMKLCRSRRELQMLGEALKEALGLKPGDGLDLKEMDERMLRRTLSILTSAWWRRRKASYKERPRRRNYGRRR